MLNQSGAAGIFLVPEFRSPMAAFLAEVRPEVPAPRDLVFFTEWPSSSIPLFHAAGCGMGVLGAVQSLAVHVPVLAFDPALVLELIEAERGAVFGGVPTMMIAMLGHPDFERRDLSGLRVAMSGGAPVPAELVQQVEARLGVRFSIVFGTTECSPLVTQVKLDDSAQDRAETLGAAGAEQDPAALGVRGCLPDEPSGKIQKFKLRESFTPEQPSA